MTVRFRVAVCWFNSRPRGGLFRDSESCTTPIKQSRTVFMDKEFRAEYELLKIVYNNKVNLI